MPHYKPNAPDNDNDKVFSRWIPLLMAAMLSTGVVFGYFLCVFAGGKSDHLGSGGTVEEVIRFIESRYVDSTDAGRLSRQAIEAILRELDPHSSFIPADELARVNEDLQGNFHGVGIRFNTLRDTIVVLKVVPDGPSARAGILAGDRILRVNDSSVVGNRYKDQEIVQMMRGEAGTKVKITIQRRGEEVRDFTVTRGEIPIESVEAAYMLDAHTGLIKISRFSGTTFEEFGRALENLCEKQGMRNLVIDLRDNPGGYLSAATKILDQLFEDRKLLVYTKGRASDRQDHHTTGKPLYKIDKLAVLVDENSASASEIIAGAVQDHDRGVLIGRRTFGKGLVQEQYDLSDGSALRLTIARYYTPSDRCIQKPYEADRDDYAHELADRYLHGELYHRDSVRIADSTAYKTGAGRTVFGGGGIMPDIFVPLDACFRNNLFLDALGDLPARAFDYWDRHREKLLKTYPDAESFFSGFQWETTEANAFVAELAARKNYRKDAVPETLANILPRFKAELARLLYGENAYYSSLDQIDRSVQEALKAINDDGYRMQAMGLK